MLVFWWPGWVEHAILFIPSYRSKEKYFQIFCYGNSYIFPSCLFRNNATFMIQIKLMFYSRENAIFSLNISTKFFTTINVLVICLSWALISHIFFQCNMTHKMLKFTIGRLFMADHLDHLYGQWFACFLVDMVSCS